MHQMQQMETLDTLFAVAFPAAVQVSLSASSSRRELHGHGHTARAEAECDHPPICS
jgi:hypothetical protein